MLRRQVQDVEGKLPEKITITIKCPMTGYQGAIYDWVRATSLLRIDPNSPEALRRGSNIVSVRNRVMEQRKVLILTPHAFSVCEFRARNVCAWRVMENLPEGL